MSDAQTVYLALGSNVGDRARQLHTALRLLRELATVEATSFLYETPPAYVTDQPPFLNAACRVTTDLTPHALLAALKGIEETMGRVKTIRFGPRNIDLDIIFYGDSQIASAELTIPHPRLAERAFVLEPLCDLAPDLRDPVSGQTIRHLLAQLHEPPLPKVMPLTCQGQPRLWQWGAQTRIVGIINLTPDSFTGDGLWQSDGGATPQVIARAVALAERLVAEGADCIDIGGQSTRPGHQVIPVEEEIARTAPVVNAVAQAVNVPVSIDTFRAPVAAASLAAGATLINDIWGLAFDPRIGRIAAEEGCALVVMHNRTHNDDPAYQQHLSAERPAATYTDIIQDIATELQTQLATAQQLGLPRWLLITDPGIGFGKSTEQHLALLRRLNELKAMLGYPLLIGASRKGFIGKLLGDLPPAARDEGTLALGVLALERGADLLRVHNVQAMSRAAHMADAVLAQG
ncbi:MAG: dihydropteroate synthase [Caldilineaceae bacterium]